MAAAKVMDVAELIDVAKVKIVAKEMDVVEMIVVANVMVVAKEIHMNDKAMALT
jgi:hypothetical protein